MHLLRNLIVERLPLTHSAPAPRDDDNLAAARHKVRMAARGLDETAAVLGQPTTRRPDPVQGDDLRAAAGVKRQGPWTPGRASSRRDDGLADGDRFEERAGVSELEQAARAQALEEARNSQENLNVLLHRARAADGGASAAAWSRNEDRGAGDLWGAGRGAGGGRGVDWERSPETPEQDDGPLGAVQEREASDDAGTGMARKSGTDPELGAEEAVVRDGDTVVEPGGASLMEGLAAVRGDGQVVVRTGEYTWLGALEVGKAVRVVGEDRAGSGAVLVGRWSLKAGSSGAFRLLRLINVAGGLPDANPANQYTPPTLRSWLRFARRRALVVRPCTFQCGF